MSYEKNMKCEMCLLMIIQTSFVIAAQITECKH